MKKTESKTDAGVALLRAAGVDLTCIRAFKVIGGIIEKREKRKRKPR